MVKKFTTKEEKQRKANQDVIAVLEDVISKIQNGDIDVEKLSIENDIRYGGMWGEPPASVDTGFRELTLEYHEYNKE